MDRETAVKLWREIGLGMPGGGATGRLIEAFAVSVEAAERERWLKPIEAALEILDELPEWSNAAHACRLLRKALGAEAVRLVANKES